MKAPRSGELLASCSALCYGLIPYFALLAQDTNLNQVLSLRYLLGGLFLLFLSVWQKQTFPTGKGLLGLVALGSVGFCTQSFFLFSALRLIPGGLAISLLYLYPVIICATKLLLRLEPFNKQKSLASSITVLGLFLCAMPYLHLSWVGIVSALVAAFVYAGYVLAAEQLLSRHDVFPSCAVMCLSASLAFFLLSSGGNHFDVDGRSAAGIVGLGIICTGLAVGTLFKSVQLIGSAKAALVSTLEPIFASVVSLVLGETITLTSVAGAALIVAGIVILQMRPPSSSS